MGNNRLYLRCRQCGAMIPISKHLMSPWYIKPETLEKINDFFEEHCWCADRKNRVFFNSFDLVSEFGEGFPREEDNVLYHYYDIYKDDYKEECEAQERWYKSEQFNSAILKRVIE